MWPQCFLSKRFPWGAASKLWPHICNCDNGYDILFGRCHQNYFLMAASIPCLLFSILVSPSLAEKILQFQQLVELLRIVLLSLTLEHSRMDCQLLWQHLSKLGLALPSWQLTQPRTKKSTQCMATVWKTCPRLLLHWCTCIEQYVSASVAHGSEKTGTIPTQHTAGSGCTAWVSTDKKPFINFVLSLFPQRLTLDGRWIYVQQKRRSDSVADGYFFIWKKQIGRCHQWSPKTKARKSR